MTTKPNLETRISNRARSIFAAFGQVVNDFYLEAGIYFVGGFNAALVSWNIYTDLLANSQPLAYAVAIAIIAFIAVEGLAVYLVGAAAKTSNGLLWFFSVVFASFFTYAHYREMATQAGIIAQYITLAIPFFVVVGYWARTVKADVESRQMLADKERDNEAARQRQIEDEERQRQRDIETQRLAREDEERQFSRQLQLDELAKNHELKMARIEAKKVSQQSVPQVSQKVSHGTVPQVSQDKSIETLKADILAELGQEKPNMTQLARRLDIGRGTLYRHLGALAGMGEVVKNGNGYEIANS